MKNIYLIFLLTLIVNIGYAQIPLNTFFDVSTPNPIDGRMVISTIGDTSTIADKYNGLLTWVQDSKELWVYDGLTWNLFNTDVTLSPSNLAQEGANFNDVLRWDGSKYAPSPTNTFEIVDTTITITVCNDLDTCDHISFQSALKQATRLKTTYDTIAVEILIVQRPNPDGSPMIWNVDQSQLSVQGGDYSGIFLSSRYKDSTYALVTPSFGDPIVQLNQTSNFAFKHLIVDNSSGDSGLNGIRAVDCNGTYFNNVKLINLRNSYNIFRGSAYFVTSEASRSSNNALWNQNGFISIAACDFYQSHRGIENRGFMVSRFSDSYNNSFANVDNKGYLTVTDDLFDLDTISSNRHLLNVQGAIFKGGLQTMSQTEVNLPFNTLTDQGIIFQSLNPYPFMQTTTVDEPSASSGIKFYYNTDDNVLMFSPDNLVWEPLVSPSNLAQEGANLNDALRWDGSKYAPSPVNSIEYLRNNINITVCNDADSCDYTTLNQAMQFSSFYTSIYDSLSEKKIRIVIRPNPDGSRTVIDEELSLTQGDYSNVKITSAWADTISIFDFNGDGSNNRFFIRADKVSGVTVDSLHIVNVGSAANRCFRHTKVTGVDHRDVTVEGFQWAWNVISCTGELVRCTAKNNDYRGFWIQDCGSLRFSSNNAFNNNRIGVHFQNAFIKSFDGRYINNGENNIEISGGYIDFSNSGDNQLENDTTSDNLGLLIEKNALVVLTNQAMVDSARAEGYRLGVRTPDYYIMSALGTDYQFQEDSTINAPDPTSGIRYYWDLDDKELKIAPENTIWEPLVSPSNLAQEGATLGQVPMWDGSQFTPQNVQGSGSSTLPLTLTVCNDLDTCDFLTVKAAFAEASKLKASVDTSTNTALINIVIRPNPDASESIFQGLKLTGGDYSGIQLSTLWDGSINRVRVLPDSSNIIVLDNLSGFTLKDASFVGGAGKNFDTNTFLQNNRCANTSMTNVTIDSFNMPILFNRSTGNKLNESTILEPNLYGIWLQTSQMSGRNNTFYGKSHTILFYNENSYASLRNLDLSGSGNLMETRGGVITIRDNALANDTVAGSFIRTQNGGTIILPPNRPVDATKIDANFNTSNGRGGVFHPDLPEPFGEYATANEPNAVLGTRLYYNTDDNEYKINEDGLTWEPLVSSSNLAQEGATLGQVPRWDGSQFTPQSINSFEFVDTSFQITVCNDADSCNFTSLNQAFEFISAFRTKHDSLSESSINVRIRNNPDGSKTKLQGLGVYNVDLSDVVLTTGGDTVIVTSVVNQENIAGGNIMFAFFDAGVPQFDNFNAIDSTGTAGNINSLQLNGVYITRPSNTVRMNDVNMIGNFSSAFRIDRSRFELKNITSDTVSHILRAEVSDGFVNGMQFDTSVSTLGAIRIIRSSSVEVRINSGAYKHLASLQGSSLAISNIHKPTKREDFLGEGTVSFSDPSFFDNSVRINSIDKGIAFFNDASPTLTPSALLSPDTVTVCNTGCDYSTLNQAFEYAGTLHSAYDSLEGVKKITILIDRNTDNSMPTFTEGLNIRGGDYSHVILTTAGDTAVYNAGGVGPTFAFMNNCVLPDLQDFKMRADTTGLNAGLSLRFAIVTNSTNARWNFVDLINFSRGVEFSITSSLWLSNMNITGVNEGQALTFENTISRVNNLNIDCIPGNNISPIVLKQGAFVSMVGCNATGWGQHGVTLNNSQLMAYNCNFMSDGITETSNDIHFFYNSMVYSGNSSGTIGGTNIEKNKVTNLGVFIDRNEGLPSPIQESTTASEPSASSNARIYYNIDDNELKITEDNLAWEPLVSPSNLAQEGATLGQVPRWDGSQFTPQNIDVIEFLQNSETITVCNDGSCNYFTLNQALEYASSRTVNVYDSLEGKKTLNIVIKQNTDGSNPVLNDRVYLQSGDFSNVRVTSAQTGLIDTVYWEPIDRGNSLDYFLRFSNCIPPILDSLKIIRRGNTGLREIAVNVNNAPNYDFSFVELDSFDRGFNISASTGSMNFTKVSSPVGGTTNAFRILGGFTSLVDCISDGYDWGFFLEEGSVTRMIRDTATNWTRNGVVSRGAYVIITDGDFRKDGVTEATGGAADITTSPTGFGTPGLISLRGTVQGGTIGPVNRITDQGLIIREDQGYPFMEVSTANEPDGASGIRFYYNTDDNELKIYNDGNGQWESLNQSGSISNGVQFLSNPDTITVCNTGCDYSTLNQAFEYAGTLHSAYDSLEGVKKLTILIDRNADNSKPVLSNGLNIKGGDYSHVLLTTAGDTAIYDAQGTDTVFLTMNNCLLPDIQNSVFEADISGGNAALPLRLISSSNSSNLNLDGIELINFRKGFEFISGSSIKMNNITASGIDENEAILLSNTIVDIDSMTVNCASGNTITPVTIDRGSSVNMSYVNLRGWGDHSIIVKNARLNAFECDFREDGLSTTPNDISILFNGSVYAYNDVITTIGQANILPNKVTASGIFVKSDRPVPFQESPTSSAPFAPFGSRFYYDTDLNELMLSKNNVDWEPITKVPATTSDVVGAGGTLSITLPDYQNQIKKYDMTSAAASTTVTVTGGVDGGVYTFHFTNTSNNDVIFPASFLNADGSAVGTKTFASDDFFTCYFDGTQFHCK